MEYKIPENATIINIKEIEKQITKYEQMMGLEIITNKGNIELLIDSSKQCCEIFDALFLETPDDINKFIGAKIIKISDICTSNACNKDDDCDETQLQIVTTRGVLQYAVYNSHNGYYEHATFIQVFNHEKREYL